MRRKLLSLALALAMCLGLTIPALAAELVSNDGYVYELSNEPIGTVEVDEDVLTVVPDNTTIICKTDPNSGLSIDYGGIYIVDGQIYLDGSSVTDAAEAGVPYMIKSEGPTSDNYFNYGYVGFISAVNSYSEHEIFAKLITESTVKALGLTIKPTSGTTPSTPTTPSTGFTDVKASDYFATPVAWAVEKGITNGTGNNQFSPNQNCTNAQILTFLWRAYGQPEPTISNPFTNAIPEAYTKAAIWAYEKGMVSGGTFDVDGLCSRAMAVTYMWQAAGSPPSATLSVFTDVPASASFAQAVAWAVTLGITTGTSDTTFSPNDICTRGQIATFLHRNLA